MMPISLHSSLSNGRIDRIAIALSGACAAHCVGTAVVLGVLASAGGIFENPLFHEVGLVLAILLGAVALGHGAIRHGFMMPAAIGSLGLGIMAGAMTLDHGWLESAYTLLGVATLALGHDLNHRAGR
ncbi:hypothetical protein K663_02800 [Sphingobium sp. MI1205]|nr:hypothetical protein K663_02800 [Sphingobium sp. MI1205]